MTQCTERVIGQLLGDYNDHIYRFMSLADQMKVVTWPVGQERSLYWFARAHGDPSDPKRFWMELATAWANEILSRKPYAGPI